MQVERKQHTGNDLTVVNAARVSFNKESSYVGQGPNRDLKLEDQKLIRFLAREGHFPPFTHCHITLYEKVPLFVARQRFKHTVGFSYNEASRRYVDNDPEYYTPDEWRGQASNKKQGSSDVVIDINPVTQNGRAMVDDYQRVLNRCDIAYKSLLAKGVCPEQARMVLPQSMYTEYYVTGSLMAFARASNLRSDENAQVEIQQLAGMWNSILSDLYPHSWAALVES